MAPDSQTHVGAVVWFGENNQKTFDPNKEYSHDNLFHTLLGLFNVETKVYKKEMDMFR
jgi:lipid A ethanolaminephosphotransferase